MGLKNIIFRVDSYSSIGTGHLMRCLALADTCKSKNKGQISFITNCTVTGLIDRLKKGGYEFFVLNHSSPEPEGMELIGSLANKANDTCDTWVVLDGAHFDGSYQRSIRQTGCKLLVIDDMGVLDKYYSHIVLNQNVHGPTIKKYNCEDFTTLLLGTEYTLLRSEFKKWRGFKRKFHKKAKKLMVTLGGGDPKNYTMKVLSIIKDIEDIEIVLVVGAGNPNYDTLKSMECHSVRIMQDVKDMAGLMAWADLAITSGGTTVWELAFMGVPALVGRVAVIEDYLLQGLNQIGLFYDIGWFETLNVDRLRRGVVDLIENLEERKSVSEHGRKIITGNGTEHVLDAMSCYKMEV